MRAATSPPSDAGPAMAAWKSNRRLIASCRNPRKATTGNGIPRPRRCRRAAVRRPPMPTSPCCRRSIRAGAAAPIEIQDLRFLPTVKGEHVHARTSVAVARACGDRADRRRQGGRPLLRLCCPMCSARACLREAVHNRGPGPRLWRPPHRDDAAVRAFQYAARALSDDAGDLLLPDLSGLLPAAAVAQDLAKSTVINMPQST